MVTPRGTPQKIERQPQRGRKGHTMKSDNIYLAIEALEEAYLTLKNTIYDLDPEDDSFESLSAHSTLIDALENLADSTISLERKL